MKTNKIQFLPQQNTKYYNKNNIKPNNLKCEKPDLHAILPVKSYHAGYYVNFKGSIYDQLVQDFNSGFDLFYEKNKGKDLCNYLNADYYQFCLPTLVSRDTEQSITKLIKKRIEDEQTKRLEAKKLAQIIAEIAYEYLPLEEGDNSESDEEREQKAAMQIINELISENKLQKSTGTEILNPSPDEIAKKIGEKSPIQIQSFEISQVQEYLKQAINIVATPKVTKELVSDLKTQTTEGPLKLYAAQMEKIKAEELKNNSPSAQACAEEIYADSIEKHISPLENRKLYEYLTLNSEKIDYILNKIIGYEYKSFTAEFEANNISQKHKVLLVDPGIHSRIDELIEFIKLENIDTEHIEPFALRQKFSDYLGTETIYRGLYFENPEEKTKQIKSDGNYASAFQNKEDAINEIKYYLEAENPATTFPGKIIRKIKEPTKPTSILSVSSIYDIAASVPKMDGKSESPVVVIKAIIPKISTIKQGGYYNNMQTSKIHSILHVGDKSFDYDNKQNEIEIFVPFHIPPTAIENISIDRETPSFRWD